LNTTDWLIIAAGLGAAAWVTWYFFLAERGTASSARAVTTVKGEQEVRITVHGGYEPSTVRVAAGKPVRLLFDRQETATCSEELVFPAFGLRKFLPAHQTTTLEVTPPSPGTYEFTCGMGMLHGRLVAE
jgi:plastocyanin domain-containing protein